MAHGESTTVHQLELLGMDSRFIILFELKSSDLFLTPLAMRVNGEVQLR